MAIRPGSVRRPDRESRHSGKRGLPVSGVAQRIPAVAVAGLAPQAPLARMTGVKSNPVPVPVPVVWAQVWRRAWLRCRAVSASGPVPPGWSRQGRPRHRPRESLAAGVVRPWSAWQQPVGFRSCPGHQASCRQSERFGSKACLAWCRLLASAQPELGGHHPRVRWLLRSGKWRHRPVLAGRMDGWWPARASPSAWLGRPPAHRRWSRPVRWARWPRRHPRLGVAQQPRWLRRVLSSCGGKNRTCRPSR